MDPNQSYNYPSNYMFPNQPPQNLNTQNPENSQNTGMQANFMPPNPNFMPPNPNFMPPNPNFMPPNPNFLAPNPNFGMQYPYNYQYMQYGQQLAPSMHNQILQPSPEQLTPRASIGSTEIPDFPRISLENDGDDMPTTFLNPSKPNPTKLTQTSKDYGHWSTEQNKTLLYGYFHFSNDGEMGCGQKGETFWNKITAYVNENSPNGPQRSRAKCESHYRDLNRRLNVWVGAYRKALSMGRSGWSDEDYISRAQELHLEEVGKRFTLMEEWKVVRNEPKYMVGSGASVSSGSKRKSSSESADISSSTPLVRPEGRDATKKANASRASSSKKKSNVFFEEKFSAMEAERREVHERQSRGVQAVEELARTNKMQLWYSLSGNANRNEYEEKLFRQLTKEIFDE